MAEVVSKIVLDVAKNITRDYILAKQGDRDSRFLEIELQNNGEKIEIPSTAKVYLNAEKSDGKVTKTSGTVLEDGSIRVRLTNQTLAVDGLATCDVSIVNGDSKLTSLKFMVSVEPSTVGDNVIVSTDEFTDLDEMVARVDELETTVIANESQRVKNETVRKEAEAKRVEENIAVKNLINSFVGNMPIANTATQGAVKAGGDITISAAGLMSLTSAIKLEIAKSSNPVGTIRYFDVNTNPSILLGFGTWVQIAKGRTIVGVDTTDSDFNLIGKQGGEKKHTLTVSEMPSHIHRAYGRNWNAQERPIGSTQDLAGNINEEIGGNNWGIQPTGGDQPHNNLQPYECYYIWKRTA